MIYLFIFHIPAAIHLVLEAIHLVPEAIHSVAKGMHLLPALLMLTICKKKDTLEASLGVVITVMLSPCSEEQQEERAQEIIVEHRRY